MNVLITSDPHGEIDKLLRILRYARSSTDFQILVIPGDFGNLQTIRFVGKWCMDNGVMGIGVYGNHEEKSVTGAIEYGSFKILQFGEVAEVPGMGKCMGIPGVHGFRRWYHWSEKDVERLAEERVDCIVSHEMPLGLADECEFGIRCGKRVIRRLVEIVRPRIFIGGHLHGPPAHETFNESLIIKSGTISGDVSWFTILNLERLFLRHYRCDDSCFPI